MVQEGAHWSGDGAHQIAEQLVPGMEAAAAEIESDMVKRVAERLAEHHVAQFGAMNSSELAMYIGRAWRDFVPQAVVAIAAMRAADPGIPVYRLHDATDDVLREREG